MQKSETNHEDTRYVIFFFVVYLLDAGRLMQESVALDTSHESSRGTTRLPSPELNADNEEFSDWDSWEGENEVQVVIISCKLDPYLVTFFERKGCLTPILVRSPL